MPGYSEIFQQEVGLNHVHYWKSVSIRGILSQLEKFQCSSVLANIKYNYAVLFLCQMNWSFVNASKCLTSLTRAKCGTRSTLCWKVGNISGSTELFAL